MPTPERESSENFRLHRVRGSNLKYQCIEKSTAIKDRAKESFV